MTLFLILPLLDLLSSIISVVVLLVLIFFVIGIIFFIGRVVSGLAVNSVLGLVSIWAVNMFFGLGIGINLLTIVVVAVFGLPAVLILVVLKLLGIQIFGLPAAANTLLAALAMLHP